MSTTSPLTAAQQALAAKHGTPPEFSKAVYAAVPGWVSMDEAAVAIDKYNAEWNAAGQLGTDRTGVIKSQTNK